MFISDHDVKRWGPSRSSEEPRRNLARLAAVVRRIAELEELRVWAAVKRVLDALEDSAVEPNFLMSACDDKKVLPLVTSRELETRDLHIAGIERFFNNDDRILALTVWRECLCSGDSWISLWPDKLATDYEGLIGRDPFLMPIAEADLRGLLIDGKPNRMLTNAWILTVDGKQFLKMAKEEWSGLPGLAELKGPGGAIEWLRFHWGRAQVWDDLDKGVEGTLAILDSDAEILFGRVGVAADGTPAKTMVAKINRPAGDVLYKEYQDLVRGGGRKTTSVLSDKYKCSVDTIQRDIRPHRPKRIKASVEPLDNVKWLSKKA